MKYLVIIFIALSTITSCSTDKTDPNKETGDYLIFGHYYGFCLGETCVETYRISDISLSEDQLDNYNPSTGTLFELLSNEQFVYLQGMRTNIPRADLNDLDATTGCPDCADGGGMYISLKENNAVTTRFIDMDKNQVPVELHKFMDEIIAAIAYLQ